MFKHMKAWGRRRPGQMNRLEAMYSEHLLLQKATGKILGFWFESIKFKLADKTHYTPDFMVMKKDGEIEIHETKGYMMDDANVKIKVAAEKFPFKFFIVKLTKETGWEWKEV